MNIKNKKVSLILKINEKIYSSQEYFDIVKFQILRLKHHYSNVIILDLHKKLKKENFQITMINNIKQLKIWKNLQSDNSFFCIIDSVNPLLDFELLDKMIEFSGFEKNVFSIGAIPGTAPEILIDGKNVLPFVLDTYSKSKAFSIYHDTQRKYNNQFNLSRPIRIKIFSKLIKKIDNIKKITVKEFIKELETEKTFNFILDYGEKVRTLNVTKCLHCNSKNFIPLYCTTSQPTLGFLPSSRSFYKKCMNCNLIFLNKQCRIEDLDKFYDKFERPLTDERKIILNLVQKKNGTHFDEKLKVQKIFQKYLKKKSRIVDLGCGFGEFPCLIKKFNPSWEVSGIDFNLDHVKKILKSYSVNVENKNFVEKKIGEKLNMISAMHVVEHIPFPNLLNFFINVHDSLSMNGYFLVTTPNYDSKIGKIFDYHLAMPPIHQTIFSDQWLINYLKKKKLFKIIKKESASVILENFESWFSYYSENAPNEDIRNMSEIWKSIHNNKKLFDSFKKNINDTNDGSETILLFQKTRRSL
jgi:2-polyprenyl-3-methyl-5-hydroxy-6-metoxy-1,4-benzoquinol methylase